MLDLTDAQNMVGVSLIMATCIILFMQIPDTVTQFSDAFTFGYMTRPYFHAGVLSLAVQVLSAKRMLITNDNALSKMESGHLRLAHHTLGHVGKYKS